jgi:hypothetical protein
VNELDDYQRASVEQAKRRFNASASTSNGEFARPLKTIHRLNAVNVGPARVKRSRRSCTQERTYQRGWQAVLQLGGENPALALSCMSANTWMIG